MNDKTELSIKTVPDAQTDIAADWLLIAGKDDGAGGPLDFESKISINPKHKSFGCVVQAIKKFKAWKRFFIAADMPLVQVEHDLTIAFFLSQSMLQ